MIILEGVLRQRAELKLDSGPAVKLWVEHLIPRDGGVPDLKLEELFLPWDEHKALPPDGQTVRVQVRPYPRGKAVAFAGVALAEVSGKARVNG